MASVLESPYWLGWCAGSWGVSWGYDGGGEPIPVEENLAPAGHWKHLLRAIKQADTPAIRAKCTAYAKVESPTTTRVLHIGAETPLLQSISTTQARVESPFVGVSTTPVVIKTTTQVRVKPPMTGATSRFLRGRGWAVNGRGLAPSCGCGTPAMIGRSYATELVVSPFTIKNPTLEELLAII